MKKRKSVRKKAAARTKAGSSGNFFYSRTFIYTSGSILGVVLLFVLLNTAFQSPKTTSSSRYASGQNVLGEDEDTAEEEAKEAAEKDTEKQAKDTEDAAEQVKQESKQSGSPGSSATSGSTKMTIQNEGGKSETETETGDGQKTKTKVEDDGKTKVEIEYKDLKIKYEVRNGQMTVKAEDENGEDVELGDDELEELEDEVEGDLEDDGIKIATGGAGQLTFAKNRFAASTSFPISVDVDTNQLVVTTPAGQKVVTVLPEQAIQNLFAANIVNRLGGQADVNEAADNDETSARQFITLGEKDGDPIYEINGISDQKLLGFIPVEVEKELTVSAETGNVLSTDVSFGDRILDLLSV